jgi:hypothetical protein
MRLFRRGNSGPDGDADFWTWWAGARDRVAMAIANGGFDKALVDEISRAVQKVHPDLAWELAKGHAAEHAFCVSPEGNAAIRPAALRWLASAPPPDATWEYHASRQASPLSGAAIDAGGHTFELESMRAITSWDERRRRLDVRLWHDEFTRAPLPVRQQVAFIFLDNLLGEDEVERWVGQVDLLDAPSGGKAPDELRAEVARHAAEPRGDTWVLGQGADRRGQPVIVMADAGLKRIDHPFADQHVSIRIRIDGGGMPDDALAGTLNREEDRLVAALAGAATLAGRTTTPGERVIHFVAQDVDAVRAGIDRWAPDAPDWNVKVDFQQDVTWEFQRELGVR